MRALHLVWISIALLLTCVVSVTAQEARSLTSPVPGVETETVPHAVPAAPGSFDEVVDRMVEKEHGLSAQMRNLRPMVETYLQNLKTDADGNAVPVKDEYFLGRLDMSDGPEDTSFVGQPGFGHGRLSKLTGIFSLHFQPLGFAQMVVLDTDLYKKYYNFTYVRREFLGEVRCIVIDAQPKADAPPGRFEGRIWVEDQDYNIVRFNGTYSKHPINSFYLHFDSWRLNLQPGVWLPAYVYSEETNLDTGAGHLHLKAQTRLWGYDLKAVGKNHNDEFTQIQVDSPLKDQSGASSDASPVMAERMWEHQAEDNVLERLQNVGLLAPSGGVDAVLQTVVNNLVLTNSLTLQSDVRCRVLITAPLESFTIGHTIVVSRGLLDVLPDEAALAMVLAHELSHIVLGHPINANLAFNDQMFFPDEQSFQRLDFRRRPADEAAADAKALELLKNSPYKEKLATAGLFLRELQQRAPDLPNLIRPHLGNSFASGTNTRMEALLVSAPQLDTQRIDQIAALPLGGRIKLDPWSDQVEMAKTQPVTLALAREKMPFEITPFFPYLTRLSNDHSEKIVAAGSGSK
jgi:hypothetical protein